MNPRAAHRVLLTVLPALILATVVVSTLWGNNGLVARQRLHAELAERNAELATIERENQRLLRQLALMERDPIVLERMVAEELSWGPEGATLYRFDRLEPDAPE